MMQGKDLFHTADAQFYALNYKIKVSEFDKKKITILTNIFNILYSYENTNNQDVAKLRTPQYRLYILPNYLPEQSTLVHV